MSVTVAGFNEILWKSQLIKNCVDCSEENIKRLIQEKETPGPMRRKLKSLLRRYSYLVLDEFISDASHLGFTWEYLARMIPKEEERNLFLATARKQ